MAGSSSNPKDVSSSTPRSQRFWFISTQLGVDKIFISRASIFIFSITILGFISLALSFNPTDIKSWLYVLFISLVNISCIVSWLSCRKGKPLIGAWLLVIISIVVNTYFFLGGSGATFIVYVCIFILTALLAMIMLGVQIAYAIIIWSGGVTFFLWLTNGISVIKNENHTPSKMGADDLILLLVVQIMVVWLADYLVTKLVRVNQITQAQSNQLTLALADLKEKRQLGEENSQEILSLSAELNATANQQASGSKEQVGVLNEVITFMQELSQTSQLIAKEAGQLNQAAQTISGSTLQAKSVSSEVKQLGESSAEAVYLTTQHNQQVNEFYDELRKKLGELQNSQTELGKVVKLIRELGDQTHLLSINAALEAAGAGEYGERFGVVASEVRGLSDRSIQASHEVNKILGHVENCIQQVAKVAESGYQEMQTALAVARDSGTTMNQLVVIIERNNQEMENIELAAGQMKEQTVEISQATNQQYSASMQGVEKLQLIGTIAAQSSSGAIQVTSSTRTLEELARRLHLTLH
jgi:methyl-accepting chemotaxis protein